MAGKRGSLEDWEQKELIALGLTNMRMGMRLGPKGRLRVF